MGKVEEEIEAVRMSCCMGRWVGGWVGLPGCAGGGERHGWVGGWVGGRVGLPGAEEDFFGKVLGESQGAGAAGDDSDFEERVGVFEVPAWVSGWVGGWLVELLDCMGGWVG